MAGGRGHMVIRRLLSSLAAGDRMAGFDVAALRLFKERLATILAPGSAAHEPQKRLYEQQGLGVISEALLRR